jgi:predicted O-methyltransferase YrrM
MLARNARRLARIAAHPGAAWTRFSTRLEARMEYRRKPCVYRSDADWEARLHERLGVARPCAAAAEFAELWPRVAARVAELGCRFGPESYYGWNDGDPELVRAVWCLVRHLCPERVVETGVAHGVTTRFILEAMERNGAGTLWSIDLPPNGPQAAAEIGIAVDGCAPQRWHLLQGSSRKLLPPLLAELGAIDLFVHDSLHTRRHVCFEVETARRHLRPGGFIVIDDIDTNWGLHTLMAAPRGSRTLVCQSEPVVPDRRRFDDRGLFAVIETPSA